ncbi:hypothetical protein C0J08_07060 [Marinomonas sp. CT5]|nr:hypothetical protein C0J08_07060 [Marinomonas sp. CT5]
MESHRVQIKKFLLQIVFVGIAFFGVTACSSIHKDTALDDGSYELEDIDQTNSADYLCDNAPLNIFFHADQAKMSWKDKSYLLTHAVSASGSFYLGEGLSFWIHGDEAELEFNTQEKAHCHLVRIES